MLGHPTLNTGFKSSVMANSSTGGQPGNVSPLPNTTIKPDEAPHAFLRLSSSELVQGWSKRSSSQNASPPSSTTKVADNGYVSFEVIRIPTWEDEDVTYTQWEDCSIFTIAHEAWQDEKKVFRVQDKGTLLECQSLSCCKLNIYSDAKKSAVINKSSSHINSDRRSNSRKCIKMCGKLVSKETSIGPSVSSQILHPATSLNKESKCFSTRGDEEFDHYQTANKRRPVSKIQEPNCHSSPSTWSRSHQYVCQHCKLEFLSNMDLFLHNYDQHGLVCGECDSRFLSSSDLLKHKEMDHPPISCCKHCRYVTFSQDELNHHIKSAHNADQKTSDSSSNPCQELHENNENLASSSRTTQTGNFVSKTDSAIYTSLDVHGNSKPHLAAVSPFKQEIVVAMPSKHFLMHDVLSGPQQYYVGNVIDKHKQDHMESHNYKNTSSESEEPSLVIDTVDYCEVNKNKLDVVRSEQGDQPLCLVVHTRENVNLHHNIFQAEEQKDVRYQQQFCHTKPFTVNEMDRKVDFSKSFLGSTGKHEKNVSFQRHHETQFAIDSRMEQGTVNGSEAYEYSSTSIACFANCESSMNATGRDFWSAELVSSGDGQLLSNSGNIPGTNCNFGPTEDHKLNRAKPASDLSATDGISLNSPLTDSTSQNGNRDLILKNDATMSSLPPKKRGLRKSPGLSSSRSSETSRTLRDESIQDIMTENGQQTPNPNLSSEPKSTAEGERKQNMSPLAELERSSRGSETKPVYIGSKAPELKEPFSCENQREHKSNQPQNCEAASLTKSELDIKAEETQENTHTYSTALNSAKDSIGNYKCPVFSCSASFSRKWTMEVHLDSKHKKDSQHLAKCKFNTCCELRQHVQEGHRGKVRRHTCTWPECGKRFFARTHLHTHMLVHTGEKPVACQLCDYRCRQRTALIWHMRKHGVYGQRKEKVNSNESI